MRILRQNHDRHWQSLPLHSDEMPMLPKQPAPTSNGVDLPICLDRAAYDSIVMWLRARRAFLRAHGTATSAVLDEALCEKY